MKQIKSIIHHLDLLLWSNFHLFGMILNGTEINFDRFLHSNNDLPVPQQTLLAAHRPFGTVEQTAPLIKHGTVL